MRSKRFLFHSASLALKAALWLLAGAVFLLILFFALSFGRFRVIYSAEMAGRRELLSAVSAARNNNIQLFNEQAAAAEKSFNDARENLILIKERPIYKNFPLYRRQIEDMEALTKSGELISLSLVNASLIAKEAQDSLFAGGFLDFKNISPEKKIAALRLIRENSPELNGIKANLSLARINLEQIQGYGLLFPLKDKITEIKGQLSLAEEFLGQAIPLVGISSSIFQGDKDRVFLVLLQNNDELRPTGGFLGTYGILILDGKTGKLKSFDSEDTYHLDMPAKDKLDIYPPAPLQKYLQVKKWFFRDANWSPNWPTAAVQAETVYKRELELLGQPVPEITGVIAITPNLAADLIDLVGPIKVKGVIYNAGNFQELLQYQVEMSYKKENISSWDRKAIIDDISAELKKRLLELPSEQYPAVLKILEKNVARKDILIYLNDPASQKLVVSYGAGGEIKKTSGDYVMLVDANLAAFKTDAVMEKNLSYSVREEKGQLIGEFKLNYIHNGYFDWRTTRYRSYSRLLVPKGSQLISINGAQETYPLENDEDLDKTIIPFFFSIEPQKSQEITITYRLPDNLLVSSKAGNYSLNWQRQPGSRIKQATVNSYLGSGFKKIVDLSADVFVQF